MKIGFVHLKGHFAVNIRNSGIYNFLVSNGMNVKDILIDENKYLASSYKEKEVFRYINFANALTLTRGIILRQSASSMISEISFNSLVKKFKMMMKEEYRNLLGTAEECNVLHAEDLWSGLLCFMVKKKFNKPYILDLHDSNVTAFSASNACVRNIKYYREIESKAVAHARYVIAVSKSAKDYLSKSYGKPQNEIFVAPNGTQLLENKAHFDQPFKIIYAGGFEPIFNVIDFVKAAEILHENRYKFYILGDGSLRNEIINYINRKLVDVVYLGFKSREKTLQILTTMQAGIYTVRDHIANRIASPLKVLDYATCGLPIILPKINETSSLVKKYDCGIVTKKSSPTEFADAIKKLNNENIWNQKSINAKKMIEKELTWEHTLKPILSIYKDLL